MYGRGMRTLALTVALAVALIAAPPAAGAWRRPVPGALTRAFAYGEDPFRAGWHRGADFAAAPGARVRAACDGRVATARGGAVGVVTVSCGPWRVTHLPLATVTVRRGVRVTAGEPVGTLAASRAHAGLHVGVRRAGDRFAYVDPLPFLGGARPPVPPALAPRRPPPRPATPRVPVPRPAARQVAAPRAGPSGAPASPPGLAGAPRAAPSPARARVSSPLAGRALAPWPAWLGLASLLLGAAGGGARIGARRRRAARAAPAREGVA
jgi:hypothetical protein